MALMFDLNYITGTKSGSGDNELIASPGGEQRIVVTGFVIQNESGSATTMILKDGDINVYRFLGQNQGDFLEKEFSLENFWYLSDNSPLKLNLSGANLCGYSVSYYTEDTT